MASYVCYANGLYDGDLHHSYYLNFTEPVISKLVWYSVNCKDVSYNVIVELLTVVCTLVCPSIIDIVIVSTLEHLLTYFKFCYTKTTSWACTSIFYLVHLYRGAITKLQFYKQEFSVIHLNPLPFMKRVCLVHDCFLQSNMFRILFRHFTVQTF